MSDEWARRERATQTLVGAIADHLLARRRVDPTQLYGLCRLTWITTGFEGPNAAYIRSTKLPALRDIFGEDFPIGDLASAGRALAARTGDRSLAGLVAGHTGVTNFYNAYRRSARVWLDQHGGEVARMLRRARRLASDTEGAALARDIARMPGIPKPAGGREKPMPAEYLLTPLLFAVDPRRRFPMINGNDNVKRLLAAIGASGRDLVHQHDAMVALIGRYGIVDSADLDAYGHKLTDFVQGRAVVLREKPTTGRDLPLKDEDDVETVRSAATQQCRRIHNEMTNRMKKLYAGYVLTEGTGAARYDINVVRFDGDSDLMVEVKSSHEEAHVRMAIGQLLAYSFHDGRPRRCRKAVLFPAEPGRGVKELLAWLDIGCLWFEGESPRTSTAWLKDFVEI